MLVKGFKKAALVLAVVAFVMTATSVALAAPAGSRLVGGKASGGDESLERELEGGIKIVVHPITFGDAHLWVRCTITMEEDVKIAAGGTILYDDRGNEFNRLNSIYIGNQNVQERMVVAGVPTVISLGYYLGSNSHEVASTYPRVGIIINGTTVNFRNVPGKK
ncbi:MAG: hypothetical protein LBD04_03230 [Synergistaceae bacterium]|nr:hypothetical protein [Synergistaceae bacterium]